MHAVLGEEKTTTNGREHNANDLDSRPATRVLFSFLSLSLLLIIKHRFGVRPFDFLPNDDIVSLFLSLSLDSCICPGEIKVCAVKGLSAPSVK